jgi:Putative metallopeptidase
MRYLLQAAFRLAAVAFALTGFAPAFAGQMAADRIHIEYVAPKNPDHQALLAQLKERRSLEKVQAIFMPFRLPHDVTIRTIGCDGDANAFYQSIDHRPTITLCYEYLQEIWNQLPTAANEDGLTPTDALVGQALFAVAHEFGHLAFDVYQVPVLGREEDAADNFATFLMLRFREDGPRLIKGAAWSYHTFIKDYRLNPKATLPLAAFSSDHGQPEERFYNMMCMAYGSDAKLYAGLVQKGYLPVLRARGCKHELDVLQFAFGREILPHINQKMGDKVLATDWLATARPPSPLR